MFDYIGRHEHDMFINLVKIHLAPKMTYLLNRLTQHNLLNLFKKRIVLGLTLLI